MKILRNRLYQSRSQRRSQFGFGLTEVIVAAILIIIIAQATTAALIISARTQGIAIEESQFLRVVNQDIERIRDTASALCRSTDENEYGNVGACAPPAASLKQRCESTTGTGGLAGLLENAIEGLPFNNNTFTGTNNSTITVSRQEIQPQQPAGASSFSVLRISYRTAGLSPELSYVSEVVPDAIGWCATAS